MHNKYENLVHSAVLRNSQQTMQCRMRIAKHKRIQEFLQGRSTQLILQKLNSRMRIEKHKRIQEFLQGRSTQLILQKLNSPMVNFKENYHF